MGAFFYDSLLGVMRSFCGSGYAPPASGFRDSGAYAGCGTLSYVGLGGDLWSSTVKDLAAHRFSFDFGVNPNHHDFRGYGYPLRCLQE